MEDEPKVNHVFGDAREGLKLTKEQTNCDVLFVHPVNDFHQLVEEEAKKATITISEKQIRQGKILNKWKRAGTYEKALILLAKRKEAKLVAIKKAKAEIVKINRAIVALKKCSGSEKNDGE